MKIIRINYKPESLLIFMWYIFLLSPFFAHLGVSIEVIFGLDLFYLNRLNGVYIYLQSILITLFFLDLVYVYIKHRGSEFGRVINKVIRYCFPGSVVFIFLQNFLGSVDVSRYPNYLYSHTGIAMENINFTGLFCQALTFVSIAYILYGYFQNFSTTVKKGGRKMNGINLLSDVDIKLVILGLLVLLYNTSYPFINFHKMIIDSHKSYEYILGDQYKYIDALVKDTKDNSVVIHPPQNSKWPAIGNQVVLRYFLFPRTLISGALIDRQDFAQKIGSAYFVLIDPDTDTAWPEINTKYLIFNGSNKIVFKSLYVYKEVNNIKIFKVDF